MPRFYAIAHRYGARYTDFNGYYIGTVHAFNSRKDRDAWVAAAPLRGGDYQRTALSYQRGRADRYAIKHYQPPIPCP